MYGRNDRGFDGGFPPKPVNVGEELDVTIEAVGEKGDGVAKKDGFVLFIPGARQGQHLRVKVTKVLRKVGFAEIVGDASAPAGSGGEAPAEAPAKEKKEEPAKEKPAEAPAEEKKKEAPKEEAKPEEKSE